MAGFLDDEDELRRMMLEAEDERFWEEEPGDEDDPLPPMSPLFGMFGMPGMLREEANESEEDE